ncbi:MAG: hypothetical protein A2W03_14105 [Candidatus Aminicenantes bacterium RBG_16_63_16]|nr:MAG: hypothetical protein A2W03_14105 [Candidatus Aminicenantes bacterium RBG_16_63_16]
MKKYPLPFILISLVFIFGPPALLGQTGSVSGRVTDPLGAGIANIRVEFFDSGSGSSRADVYTDGSGNYSKPDLAVGTYKILFYFEWPTGIPAVPEWYNDKPFFSTADIITVTAGGSLTGINAQLRFDPNEPNDNITQAETLTPGTYTDRIQYAEGDADWHKVYVAQGKDLRFSTTNCRIFLPDPALDDMDIAIRDSAGNLIGMAVSARSEETIYAANLTAGWYYVNVEYTTSCLYDMIIAVGDLAIGEITGRVTNSLGQGIQNIGVKFYPENLSGWDDQLYDAFTDAGGYFHFAFTGGNYKALFQTPDIRTAVPSDLYVIGGFYYPKTGDFAAAQTLTIAANQTLSGIDATYADGAAITGHVTDNLGNPVPGQFVRVYDELGNQIAFGWTDNNGDYIANGVFVENGKCKVRFQQNQGGQALEWYNDKTSYGAADWVSIQPRQTASAINAQLAPEGKIFGQVTDGTNPIGNVQVIAYDTTQTLISMGSSITGPTGNYQIRYLPTANVRLLFHANTTSFASEWHNDKASFDTADSIAVTSGGTVSGVNAVLVQGGSVSGTVTDSKTGALLNGIRVELWTAANQFYQSVTANTSGFYVFSGVAAGNYKLYFNRLNRWLTPEWYNDKADFASADTITVTAGQALTGRDAGLTPVGRVRGRVTNLSAVGIQNVTVQVRDSTNQAVGSDTTDSMGYYYIYAIPEGTYWAYFDGTAAGYASEYYRDKMTFAAGDTITVSSWLWNWDINAQLAAGGGITGRVTGPGGAGIQNIRVQIKDVYGNTVVQPLSDINGDYSSGGLAAGTYRVLFSNNGLDYVSEWYSDRYALWTAADVTVLAGSTTSNINAQLEASGTISGTVTDGSAGVNGVKVELYDTYLNSAGLSAMTNASGNYTLRAIPAGSYKVLFNTSGAGANVIREWYNDKLTPQAADVINVTAGGTLSGINAVLAAGGIISGRVTSQSTGLGIGEITVNAVDSTGVWAAAATTDGSGNFQVKGLVTGSYKLEFNPFTYNSKYAASYIREFFNNKLDLASADPLAVTAGQTLSGVNASLASGGATISGRVSNAGGMGLRNVIVRAELQGYELSTQYSVSTGIDGTYTIRGIPAGTYFILFSPTTTPGNYARELYNDVVPRGWVWTGTPVVLTDGAVVPNIDAVLETCGWVTGRVTNGAGAGIANVQVRTHDALTNDRVDAGPKTDAAGYYSIGGVRPGQYKIFFSASEAAGGQYAAEFYNDKLTLPAADGVTVTADQTTANIDAVLGPGTAGGTIAGQVRDVQGNPIANAGIQVFTLDGGNCMLVNVGTDVNGAFSLGGFIPGSYKLLTQVSWLGIQEWYSDKTSYAAADTVTVSAGQTTTTDVYLGDSGTLTLTAPNGGEVLNVGQSFSITWTSSGTLGNVKLEYSTNSGTNWTTIIASTENDGSYSWTVPNTPSITCLARVSETDGNPSDTSNAVFTIGVVVSPTITVGSPNGGESLTIGAVHAITWSSTGVAGNIKIDYSTDGGSGWLAVIASTENDGSYAWTVPNTPSTNCLVRVSETDGSPSDTSNAVFTIAAVMPPSVNGLAVDFGTLGLWTWDNYVWTQLTGANADGLAAADTDGDLVDELAVDFGMFGCWLADGAAWTQLSGVNADGLIAADTDGDSADGIVGDFGTTGLWLWNLGTWMQLSGVNADWALAGEADVDGREELAGDFGATGLWFWNESVWSQISGLNADAALVADIDPNPSNELVVDFGGTGLWFNAGGAWTQISGVNPEGLAAGQLDADPQEELICDFGALGAWVYDAGAWAQISGANPELLIAANVTADAGDEVVADFGTIGIWLFDTGGWVQISGVNPELLVAANIDLDQETEIAADFGTLGVWLWNNGVWNQISASNPENIIAKW